ncbi:MAG TPA: polysaccharide deacetylase family protein [Conexibacter sp.]|nr:polysaccharide deacetylase family protein [Conexibacter sp.]
MSLTAAGALALVAGGAVATAAGPGGAVPGETPPAGGGTTTPAPVGPVPLHLHAATLRQDGGALVLSLSTSRPWTPASLGADHQSLCLRLVYELDGFASRDLCVARGAGKPQLSYFRVLRAGGHGPQHQVQARVWQPDERSLVARFSPAKLKIPYSSVRWRVLSSTDGCRIRGDAGDCFEALPPDGGVLRLRAPQPIGCTVPGPSYVTNGPRDRRVVALTFDDGPSSYTAPVLDVLRRERVPATFFLIGQQVSSGAALVKRMLTEGHMVAGHSWNHANLSSGGLLASGQISSTANAIQRASGFRPCLWRAPYGAVSPGLIGVARGLGETTVQWDVDTNDWMLPGSGTIASRALGARSGSIVLMHDGGGSRSQTLAALPTIIRGLRSRGYGFVTVTDLLRASMRFG